MQKNKQAVLLLLLTLSFLLSTSCKRVNQTKITTANGDDTSEVVDSTPPTNPSISINSGSSLTSITVVTLTLSATDASQMYVSNTAGCVIGGSWEAYNTTKSWTLGQTNTVATVYVKYRDSSSNESSCASASITHDNTSPSGESISINSGAFVASSTSVTLTLAASDAAEMYVTNTLGCDSDGTWEAYNTSKAWTLGQSNALATVYVKFRDEALNESTCANDDITHDNIAPPGGTISINGGATYTTTTAVTLTLGATGASQMYITNTSGCGSDGSWENYNTIKAWTLGQTNVVATSYVKYRDEALNETSCYSAAIIHDNTPPIGGSIAINGGDASTSSTSVTVTLSATGASQMYVTNTSGCASGGALESYATSKEWTLGQTNGTATVYVKYVDDVGNETACLSDEITHVDSSPTIGTEISFTNIAVASVTINWGAASDDSTAASALQYKVVRAATSIAIDTIDEVDTISGSALLMNWTANITSTNALQLTSATTYYFAVLVKDEANNKSLYTPKERFIGKMLYVTTQAFDGNLGGIAGADAKCSANRPIGVNASSVVKAMIVDGINRRACTSNNCASGGVSEQIDWVLTGDTHYYNRIKGLVWDTNYNRIWPMGSNFYSVIDQDETSSVWTGFNFYIPWTVNTICGGWTSNSSEISGSYGDPGVNNDYAISDLSSNSHLCSTSYKLYCAEQ